MTLILSLSIFACNSPVATLGDDGETIEIVEDTGGQWSSATGNGSGNGGSGNGSTDDTGSTTDDEGDLDQDGDGWTPNQGDCDDGWAGTHPDAPEWCDDGSDNDCDGDIDESDCTDGTAVDADGDGYDVTEDCDDNNAAVNPSATEYCDGIDNDCNGVTDGEWS